MADQQSSSSIGMSLLKGVGGAALTVITAVLIYYFTHPPTPPPPPLVVTVAPPIEVDGLVSDAATNTYLRNANVTITLGDSSVQQFTDSSGRYAVVFPAPGVTAAMGKVSTEAAGYKSYSNSVALHSGDNFAQIPLDNLIPPVVTAPATGAAPAPPLNQAMILHKPPPNYIKLQGAIFAHKINP